MHSMSSNRQFDNRKTFAFQRGAVSKRLTNIEKCSSVSRANDIVSFLDNTRICRDENSSRNTFKNTTEKKKFNCKVEGNRNSFCFASKRNLAKSKSDINSTTTLIKLLKESESEILYTLLENNAYVELLDKDKYEPEFMAAVLNVLGKASEASQPSTISKLIHEILSNHHFLTQVQMYILRYRRNNVIHEVDLNALVNFLKLLKEFQFFEPSNSIDTIVAILPLLECTCDDLTSKGVSMQEFNNLLSDIKKQKDDVIKLFNKNNSRKGEVHEDPPDDYRSLSIIPTVNDIKEVNAFIRPNIIEGKYADTEHYLDVQFRLLREDYMRPLRHGIQQYLYLSATNQLTSKALRTIQDIKFYQDFQVLYPIFDSTGVLYLASFDNSFLSQVNWECSKRFLTGSLICFSNNNFDSIFFASIAQWDTKFLKQGILVIKLEESSCESLECGASNSYIMVETEAYFEAYRHNLSALKQMNKNNMPLQDYIVQVKKEIQHPSYMNISTRYRMFSKYVPVLMCNKWPTKEQFGFDETQYEAFKAAITKEFSIIQGPPGTGKTFIALKITEMLLQNKYNPSPILVVCYTNHALDQFLEGMLSYTERIGRVGGRCVNENLSPYQLKNLRIKERKESHTPQRVRQRIGKTCAELRSCVASMDQYNDKFDACFSNILCDQLLLNVMYQNHYSSLFSVINNTWSYDGNLIKDWLGLRPNKSNEMNFLQDKTFSGSLNKFEGFPDQRINNADVIGMITDNEIDIKDSEAHFLEGIRVIDDDVFEQIKGLHIENKEEINENDGEWKTSFRKNRTFIRRKLKSTKAMIHSEVCKVIDVWELPLEKRWALYAYWVECYMNRINQDIFEAKENILRLQAQLQEIRNKEDVYVLEKCDIIGITTTGAAKYKNLVKELKPQIVIFEEAAEVLEAHVVTSLTEDTKHVILIGDHQQLRPNPTVYELAKKYNFDVSLFERMVKNGLECHKLTFQHRMRLSIANLLVPHIYPDLKNHESVFSYDDVKGVDKNMFFINHSIYETENTEIKSHANEHEAKFILALATYLIMQGYKSSQITILTTYSGQLFLLKKLEKSKLIANVRITIVDNYQGEENDIILISFVRSNKHGGVGFLKISNRVCVSLSRAKKGLYCIGNFDLLGKSCDLWKEIQSKLVLGKNIGSTLKLNCQLHPETSVQVSTAEDFKNVPDGGCLQPCGKKLACGHVCIKKCHPTDLDHLEYQCMESCRKILCENEHSCPALCYQKCTLCKVPMLKTIPYCGHKNEMPCQVNPLQWSCNTVCSKTLPCGHTCLSTCGRCRSNSSCVDCKVKITTSASCGHNVTIPCHKKSDLAAVQDVCCMPCKDTLSCGHTCKGTCRTCLKISYNRKMITHIKCKEKCEHLMNCGHECKNFCGDKCSHMCHEMVDKKYSCDHKARVKCSDFSSAECYRLCMTVLPCGHICLGNCTKCKNGGNHIPCKETVIHTLVCGHTLNISCSSTDHPLCEKMCTKNLPCGHKCYRKCYEPCEIQCNAVVILCKPCGHVEPSLCCERYQKCEACISTSKLDDTYSSDSDLDLSIDF